MSRPVNANDVQVLFADLQPQLIASSRTVPPERIAASASVLAEVARILRWPTTFAVVPVAGQAGTLIPELQPYANTENTQSRSMASPFMEPSIVSRLASEKRPVLVIVGFSAEVAVLQSALDAIAAGYSVHVPLDAVGSRSERTEAPAIRQIERAGGITTSVLSLATRMAPAFSREPGLSVLTALAALR